MPASSNWRVGWRRGRRHSFPLLINLTENWKLVAIPLLSPGSMATAPPSKPSLLLDAGILPDDPRLATEEAEILETKAAGGQFKIPDFPDFRTKVERAFETARGIDGGTNADYIDELAKEDPTLYAFAACTVDGQRMSLGDDTYEFSVQSTVKPVLYGMALERYGEAEVHRYVGREPSGVEFNKVRLSKRGVPHNPVNNAGAITTASLMCDPADGNTAFHYKRLAQTYKALGGNIFNVGFSVTVFDSERETATRNRRIALTIKETGPDKPIGFPPHVKTDTRDVERVLEFYFKACSIEQDVRALSVLAATLANGGVCPLTGEQVFSPETVKYVLTVMDTCGMYDYSGEFKNRFGQPAKSGVSGVIIVVIPGHLGFAVFSPPLDKHHNSFRGLAFCQALWDIYTFHPFDGLVPIKSKTNPFVDRIEDDGFSVYQANQAAFVGNLSLLRSLTSRGYDLTKGDYDKRSPIHLAVCGGHLDVITYLVEECGADPSTTDRWGHSPLEEATTAGFDAIVEYLSKK